MMRETAKLKGIWNLVHRDISGKIISDSEVENLITNEGFNHLLDVGLHGGTSVGTWYIIPFITSFTAALGSTYAGGGGGTEGTNYDEATRQEWDEGASSGQSVSNASPAVITASSGGLAVIGIGIVGAPVVGTTATKGDTGSSGAVLLCEAVEVKTLAEGETLSCTYTISKA